MENHYINLVTKISDLRRESMYSSVKYLRVKDKTWKWLSPLAIHSTCPI